MSRLMQRHRLEQQASRILKRGPDDLPEYQRVWVCKAYAQAKLMDAEDVADVDLACDYTGDGRTGGSCCRVLPAGYRNPGRLRVMKTITITLALLIATIAGCKRTLADKITNAIERQRHEDRKER